MTPKFLVEVKDSGTTVVVNVQGEVDVYTGHELNNVFKDVIDRGKKEIVLNLENTQYIDSTGLGIIAYAARNLSQREGKINVVSVRPQVMKIFEMSGLSKKNIYFFDKEAEALQDIS
jgi:anti-anti-sigma factor